MNKFFWTIILTVVLTTQALAGWRLTGKEFPPVDRSTSQELALTGIGVKTLFMMRVFIAAFYLPADIDHSLALTGNIAKNLIVRFYVGIPAKTFTNYTLSRMKVNMSKQEVEDLHDQIIRMGELFPHIKSGDTLALAYTPGQGTSFIHNGALRGTIEGELFAKAIFSTWIGPKPFDHIVKKQILGIENYKSPLKMGQKGSYVKE